MGANGVCSTDDPVAVVEDLYVAPDYRGRGIATQLFRKVLQVSSSPPRLSSPLFTVLQVTFSMGHLTSCGEDGYDRPMRIPFISGCCYGGKYHQQILWLISVKPRAGLPVAGVPHTKRASGGRVLLEADARRASDRGGADAEPPGLEEASDEAKTQVAAAQKNARRRRRRLLEIRDRRRN